MKYIPYGKQYIDDDDIKQVVRILKSDWITQGRTVDDFEKAIARYCGAKYAVAVSSGTAALHIACLAGGLSKGDEAVTTPITFLATPNAVLYAGAKPVFADVDPVFANIDPREAERKISSRTRAVLPVHFAGMPCDMPEISRIAKKHGLFVVEDACHALGAEYTSRGKRIKVGSCEHSDMTVLSFHPVKHITTGEGGAVTTNSRKLYKKLKALRTHGTYKTASVMAKKGSWYYEMRDLGFNYRITDFQCAMGISQLAKIDGFLRRRNEIASLYRGRLGGIKGVEVPPGAEKGTHAYHLYPLRIDYGRLKTSRQRVLDLLRERGIMCQVHYIPVYKQPYYRKLGYKSGSCPRADMFYQRELSIPMYPSMKKKDVLRVADALLDILKG